jgi:hypothetical protein
VGVPPRSDRMDFDNPLLSKWHGTGLIPLIPFTLIQC